MTNAVTSPVPYTPVPATPFGMTLEELEVATFKRSYAFIGLWVLIRAALLKAPDNVLNHDDIKMRLHAMSPRAVAQMDEVLDTAFRVDREGRYFSPSVDRQVLRDKEAQVCP